MCKIIIILFSLITFMLSCNNTTQKSLLQEPTDTQDTTLIEKDSAKITVQLNNTTLTAASKIMLEACDNYLVVNPKSQRLAEVKLLKASVYYNSKRYEKSRKVYKEILESYKERPEAIDATRMIAQTFYEEKNFNKAQTWYRTLKSMADTGTTGKEVTAKIAESIFKMAEMFEEQEKFTDAAVQYERVSLEFSNAVIAPIALFNAGVVYEKQTNWSRAILTYQKLRQKYKKTDLLPKAMFRTAKSYEKLSQWNEAAQSYLRLVANYPASDLVSTSLYNAGFAFENGKFYSEAAATFEKLAISFPKADDAADILFKAGELYGKTKEWESVTRVNTIFSKRFGQDKDRIVQAQCMMGVALYMQGKKPLAINQLKNATSTYSALKTPSSVNKFYAAKAQFTLAEIFNEYTLDIKLKQPKSVYQKSLNLKSKYLDKTIIAYSKVIQYAISEWTTRSIFQMGQAYEDFALAIFNQERPKNLSITNLLALELGIAQAVDEYFVNQALHYHEQNVKLAIKENITNKYTTASQKKLTYLPYISGTNYLNLVEIANRTNSQENITGFALVGKKLKTLQEIAPFQERSISLFLKTLELGTIYKQFDENYKGASKLITKTSFTVGQTYADVVSIARSAPVPDKFSPYEEFVYKTKLLSQIKGYEDNALTNYLKVLKISSAYSILDTFVTETKLELAKFLFMKARSYDLLCNSTFTNPPLPKDITEEEKEEYKVKFEEIALSYQEEAFSIYTSILDYYKNNYLSGEYVNHAYARLYQNFPEEYGVKVQKEKVKVITSDSQWRCFPDSVDGWYSINFNDAAWDEVIRENSLDKKIFTGFENKTPTPIWNGGEKSNTLYFRRSFYLKEPPIAAKFYIAAIDEFEFFLNENEVKRDSTNAIQWQKISIFNLKGQLRKGKNTIAIRVKNNIRMGYGLLPLLKMKILVDVYMPKFPGTKKILSKKELSEDLYKFPFVKNFSPEKLEEKLEEKDE